MTPHPGRKRGTDPAGPGVLALLLGLRRERRGSGSVCFSEPKASEAGERASETGGENRDYE